MTQRTCVECGEILPRHCKKPCCEVCWFWSGVDRAEGCWTWARYRTTEGYGRFVWMTVARPAHCVAYEWLVGPIAAGLILDHLCRNRACIRPDHLEPVTSVENVMRGMSAWAVNARKTHCKRGHEFTPENTRMKGRGRCCRTCARLAQLKTPPSGWSRERVG